jgi:hypothetical protein
MKHITIKTHRNKALLLHCFPDAGRADDTLVVYLGGNVAAEAVVKLRKVSPYLAQLIEQEIPNGWASFRLPPEPRKGK